MALSRKIQNAKANDHAVAQLRGCDLSALLQSRTGRGSICGPR